MDYRKTPGKECKKTNNRVNYVRQRSRQKKKAKNSLYEWRKMEEPVDLTIYSLLLLTSASC